MNPTELIWMNGEFLPWQDAKVHVLTHGLHYGTGVFEGIRCYDSELGPAMFRNAEHMSGCCSPPSCTTCRCPTTSATAGGGARAGGQQRPLLLLYPPDRLSRLRLDGAQPARCPRGRDDRLLGVGHIPGGGGDAQRRAREGSSWGGSAHSLIPHAKASGQYLNSVLAKIESMKAGYEEAILLDDHGHVCEGTGENVYVVREGEIATPGQHNSILDGITRRSVMQSRRTSATRSWSATWRARRCTSPTRSYVGHRG